MKLLRSIGSIINLKTLVIAVLSVISTYLCRRYALTANFPLTIVGVAIVFPIVFSIGGAYKRREAALDDYGSIKAHGRALYYACRDWMETPDPQYCNDLKSLLLRHLSSCRELFSAPVTEMEQQEKRVYDLFSDISQFLQGFRKRGMPSGELSRCNQFLSKMIVSFEQVKHIYQYRTPQTLRAYSKVFIFLLPVLYGPYFADLSRELAGPLAYMMPVLFSVIFVSLDNIQDHLENPFDQMGADDITINAEKFVERLDPPMGQSK